MAEKLLNTAPATLITSMMLMPVIAKKKHRTHSKHLTRVYFHWVVMSSSPNIFLPRSDDITDRDIGKRNIGKEMNMP